ncbi:MAG: hypothetical protein MHM6MM_007932 [Cercozoa sp. M6MM]
MSAVNLTDEFVASLKASLESSLSRAQLSNTQKVLLLGDGDLSFGAALARMGVGSAETGALVVSTFDDLKTTQKKYGKERVTEHIAVIEQVGGTVHHKVDATRVQETLKTDVIFDRVFFLFPHTGTSNFNAAENIRQNASLLRCTFASVAKLLDPSQGELHLTLKNLPIYNSWRIHDQISASPLALKNRRRFAAELFLGYAHRQTASKGRAVANDEAFEYIIAHPSAEWKTPKHALKPLGQEFRPGMFQCKPCSAKFDSQQRLDMHLQSRKHRETTGQDATETATVGGDAGVGSAASNETFECHSCRPKVVCNSQATLDAHLRSEKHKRKERANRKRLRRQQQRPKSGDKDSDDKHSDDKHSNHQSDENANGSTEQSEPERKRRKKRQFRGRKNKKLHHKKSATQDP